MANGISPYDKVRILVIEDESYIRRIICRLLRQIGFSLIDEAENGADGLREVLRVKPNVVLCDIHMEPVDGLAFLKTLRSVKDEALSKIPVIFLTADKERNTVMSAKEHRVDGYLAKPVSAKALKDRLDAVLQSK
jgi:two-component system chemotaxis response regulator CheY